MRATRTLVAAALVTAAIGLSAAPRVEVTAPLGLVGHDRVAELPGYGATGTTAVGYSDQGYASVEVPVRNLGAPRSPSGTSSRSPSCWGWWRPSTQLVSRALTSADTREPSAWPATRPIAAFMTLPMSCGPDAPTSAMASSTIAASSSSESCAGR
jgi:hypothetical protein